MQGLVGFTAVLRSAGLQITTDRVAAFLTRWTSSTSPADADLLVRAADPVRRPDDLPRYDQAFEPGSPRPPVCATRA